MILKKFTLLVEAGVASLLLLLVKTKPRPLPTVGVAAVYEDNRCKVDDLCFKKDPQLDRYCVI